MPACNINYNNNANISIKSPLVVVHVSLDVVKRPGRKVKAANGVDQHNQGQQFAFM